MRGIKPQQLAVSADARESPDVEEEKEWQKTKGKNRGKTKERRRKKRKKQKRTGERGDRRKSILQVLQPTVGLKTSAINFPLPLARACDLAVRGRGESAFL